MQIGLPGMYGLAVATVLTAAFGSRAALAEERTQRATFAVTFAGGKVDRIAIHVPATGRDYLVDRFVEDATAIAREAASFRMGFTSPGCTSGTPDRECRRSCAFAENARPFMRLRRRTADGRLATIWPVGKARADGGALKFYAGASSASSRAGDCVSPDGRFISLYIHPAPFDGDRGKSPAIAALKPDLPAVPFQGVASGKTYGEDRYFDFAGWKPGEPHTLRFSWGGDDGSGVDDEALPRP